MSGAVSLRVLLMSSKGALVPLSVRLRRRMREWGLSRRRVEVALHVLLHRRRDPPWLGDTRVFLGTGMGRSGTRFLSRLLDRAPTARVVHEPVDEDIAAFRHGYCSPDRRHRYIERFRLPEIDLRLGDDPPEVYGEVNSHLRRHVSAIRNLYPKAQVFHLVRDGRHVVRSMYSRGTMQRGDRATDGIGPCMQDGFRTDWDQSSRFERLCWYWASNIAFVRERAQWTVRLEDLLSDYGTFRADVLDPLGLQVERSVWKSEVNNPRNETGSHVLPPPDRWQPERKRRFWEICGGEMERCGYG